MRSLVVTQYSSLDGVVQAPGHAQEDPGGGFTEGGWTEPFMPDHRRYGVDLYRTAGAFLFGARTFRLWLGHWPQVTDPADHIAAALNGRPKYVASTTLDQAAAAAAWPGTTVLADDLVAAVTALKHEPGDDIVVPGSGRLVHTLTAAGLVDRYQLWLHPLALGTGKRLFERRLDLDLLDVTSTASSLVLLTYGPRS
jgi:dihydrofolate reductase